MGRLLEDAGIGNWLINSVFRRDYPVLQSGVLLVGIGYLVTTLVADIVYSLLNPRIRFGAVE